MDKKIKMFDVDFNVTTTEDTSKYLSESIRKGIKIFIQTVNVDHLILMRSDRYFKEIVESADIVTCDGMPIVWTSKIKRTPLPERVTGADLTVDLFKKSNEYGFKIFILGAAPGVAEKAANEVKRKYQGANITGVYSPSSEELYNEDASRNICNIINDSETNILLMALGTPKQEKWYYQHKNKLNVNVVIGVGAAIDFIAGTQKRAPVWLRKIGLEWFYRLLLNPKRMFSRYIVRDSKFIPMFIKEIKK
jgi:N-acetylglucosaminyldiphosphoundecaprenol N-acetyl-beta-D-mannosaminyltransferase